MGVRLYVVFEKGAYDTRMETFGVQGGYSLRGMLARTEMLLRLWPHSCDLEQMSRPVAAFEVGFGRDQNPLGGKLVFSAARSPGGGREDLFSLSIEDALNYPLEKLERIAEEMFERYREQLIISGTNRVKVTRV